MKRFRFQLEPVLDFKQQRLDALQVELGAIQAQVRAQEDVRNAAEQRLIDFDEEYDQKKALGMTIVEALEYQNARLVLERRLKQANDRLKMLQRQAEEKRAQVVDARKETHTLERLKDIRRTEYNTAVQKAEEKNLDDLTAAKRHAAQQTAAVAVG